MKGYLINLELLLASLGLNRSELRQLLTDLRNTPIDHFVQRVETLTIAAKRHALEIETDTHQESQSRTSGETSVGARVERLLRIEANLSSTQAYEVLSKMIIDAGLLKKNDIPPLSKKALRVWVDRILLRVSAKDLLQLATIARNRYVHAPTSDWILGKRR